MHGIFFRPDLGPLNASEGHVGMRDGQWRDGTWRDRTCRKKFGENRCPGRVYIQGKRPGDLGDFETI